jgi:protein-S-isoprenylcysteine O-methyltransferase Ste14
MRAAFPILAALCLAGLAIRTVYEILKQAGKTDTKSKPVFALVFAGMCLMLLSWPLMTPVDPLPFDLPDPVRGLGLALLIMGLGLAAGGLLQLRGLENIDHLVDTGLFARLRHPMYTGFILWILGWIVFSGGTASLLIGIAGILCILYWRQIEERNLDKQFGTEYQKYKKQTWF